MRGGVGPGSSRPGDGDEDLVAGARLRTEVALAAVARAAALPGERHGASGAGRVGARVRWRIAPRAALAAAAVLVVLGGAAAWWWWPAGEPARVVSLERPAAGDPVPDAGGGVAEGVGAGRREPGDGGAASGGASGAASADVAGVVVVHVVGSVGAPGVVRLPAGSRVTDAVAAAGGALPDADLAGVNLARVLSDGEQVVVPAAADGAGSPGVTPGAGPGTAGGAASGVLDLNAADADALDALPGIGPVLAQRIVAWRASHGRFTSVDELAEVTGIGPTLLAGLQDLVRV